MLFVTTAHRSLPDIAVVVTLWACSHLLPNPLQQICSPILHSFWYQLDPEKQGPLVHQENIVQDVKFPCNECNCLPVQELMELM